jgi:hypothetical protein
LSHDRYEELRIAYLALINLMSFVLRIPDLYEPHGHVACGTNGMWVEDVSACGTANKLPVVSPLLTSLLCGQPHSPASVPPYECGRSLHTGKSWVCAVFSAPTVAFHFSSPPQWGQGPGSMSLDCTSYSTYRKTRAPAVCFKSDGPNTSRLGQGLVPTFSLSALTDIEAAKRDVRFAPESRQ